MRKIMLLTLLLSPLTVFAEDCIQGKTDSLFIDRKAGSFAVLEPTQVYRQGKVGGYISPGIFRTKEYYHDGLKAFQDFSCNDAISFYFSEEIVETEGSNGALNQVTLWMECAVDSGPHIKFRVGSYTCNQE